MNTLRIDHGPLHIDNRVRHRERMARYNSKKGWQNYDFVTKRQATESHLTTWIMVAAFLGAAALWGWSIAGYQETVISALVEAL